MQPSTNGRKDRSHLLNQFTTLGPPVVAVFAIVLWCYIHLPDTTPALVSPMSTIIPRHALNTTLFNASLITALHNTWFAPLSRHATAPTPTLISRWFGVDSTPEVGAAFDGTCRRLFLPALSSIGPTKYPLPAFTSHAAERALAPSMSAPFRALPQLNSRDEVEKTDAALALVLLLDQIPRNIFRGEESRVVYGHYDRLARSLIYCIFFRYTSEGLETSEHENLSNLYDIFHQSPSIAAFPVRKSWLLMPLMHSEYLDDHDTYMSLGQRMKAEADAREEKGGADWAARQLSFEDKHRAIIDEFGRYPYRNKILGRETTRKEEEWLEASETFGTG